MGSSIHKTKYSVRFLVCLTACVLLQVRKNQLLTCEGMGYLEAKHHLLLSIEFNPSLGFLLFVFEQCLRFSYCHFELL